MKRVKRMSIRRVLHTGEHIGKNNDDEKYVRNLTVKKMLEFLKELDILTQVLVRFSNRS